MATTVYFEKTNECQGGEVTMDVEFGISSYFEEDSIYLNVEGKSVVMDRKTAMEFVAAAISLGQHHHIID